MGIEIQTLEGDYIKYEKLVFSGGEVHVRLPEKKADVNEVMCHAFIKSSEDLMLLALIKDALDRQGYHRVHLSLPYIPYARQDRVCNKGESFSLKVFANMLNAMKFANVLALDPHSDVAGALIDRLDVLPQSKTINVNTELTNLLYGSDKNNAVVIAPDAGSTKKSETIASRFGLPLIQAGKKRDLKTGKLTGFEVFAVKEQIEGKQVFIFDDICDGGGTFLGLHSVLEELNPSSVHIFFTNGIFSNPEQFELIKEKFDSVHVTVNWLEPDTLTYGI